LRLSATVEGGFQAITTDEIRRIDAAGFAAVDGASSSLQTALRAQTAAALGDKLGKAWGRQVYGKRADAGALVFSKSARLIRAFTDGAVISVHGAHWLVISTDLAVRLGWAHDPKHDPRASGIRGKGGNLGNPAKWSNVAAAIAAGKLRFILIAGGSEAVIVTRPGAKQKGAVLFVLVKQTRVSPRLSLDEAVNTARDLMVKLFLGKMEA
jgi:hypothetical protein